MKNIWGGHILNENFKEQSSPNFTEVSFNPLILTYCITYGLDSCNICDSCIIGISKYLQVNFIIFPCHIMFIFNFPRLH